MKTQNNRSEKIACQHQQVLNIGALVHSVQHEPNQDGVRYDPVWWPMFWCRRCGAIAVGSKTLMGSRSDVPPPDLLTLNFTVDPTKLPTAAQWVIPQE